MTSPLLSKVFTLLHAPLKTVIACDVQVAGGR